METGGELFGEAVSCRPQCERLRAGAFVLRGLAAAESAEILKELVGILAQAPLRHMTTPGGFLMSVAMSNCGALGWVSDRSGYRYSPVDPESGRPWPAMPAVFSALATRAAMRVGHGGSFPMRASSIATSPARGSRCIRTGTSGGRTSGTGCRCPKRSAERPTTT